MGNQLLSSLSAPDVAAIAPYLNQIALAQGSVLHESGALIDTIYFPLSGVVSLLAVMKGGEATELACVGREGAVGLSAHSGLCRARSYALVQAPGLAIAISSSVLWTMISQSETMRDLMFRYESIVSAQGHQLAACNALHSVEERVARWLLQFSDRIGDSEFPATHDIIAQSVGVRRTTITLVAQKFQRNGLIHYHRGYVAICARDGLKAVACECYDAWRRAEALFEWGATLSTALIGARGGAGARMHELARLESS
jgi:CRP-like cAMP-binding protein